MNEIKRNHSDLEQRLRSHYQQHYGQPPDPLVVRAHLSHRLVSQQKPRRWWNQVSLDRSWKRLSAPDEFFTVRHKAGSEQREDDFMKSDTGVHEELSVPELHPTRSNAGGPPQRGFKRAAEAGLAVLLVASLLIAWFAVTRLHRVQETTTTAKPLFTYTSLPGENVYGLQWTPDGKYLVFGLLKAATDHYRFLVWNAATGKVEQTLSFTLPRDTSSSGGSSLAISPDGRYMLIIIPGIPGKMGTIALANVLTGHIEQIYQVHGDKGNAQVAFSNDSKHVAFIGDDERIHTWDIAAGKFTLTSDPIGLSGTQIAWGQDGKSILIESFPTRSGQPRTLQIWNAFTGHKIESIVETPTMWFVSPSLALTAGISPDLQRIMTYNQQAKTFEVRATRTLKVQLTFHFQLLDYAQVSPSGFLEAGSGTFPFWLADGKLIFLQKDSKAYIWDATTGQLVTVFSSLDGTSAVLATQKWTSGQYAALLQRKVLQIWDLITATKVRTISLTSHPTAIYWLHDKRHLNVTYGGEKENSVGELYDAFTGELITTYQGDYAELANNGKYIASGDNVPDPKNGNVLKAIVKVLEVPR